MIAKTNQSSVRLKECMARATYVFMHVISSKLSKPMKVTSIRISTSTFKMGVAIDI